MNYDRDFCAELCSRATFQMKNVRCVHISAVVHCTTKARDFHISTKMRTQHEHFKILFNEAKNRRSNIRCVVVVFHTQNTDFRQCAITFESTSIDTKKRAEVLYLLVDDCVWFFMDIYTKYTIIRSFVEFQFHHVNPKRVHRQQSREFTFCH